MEPIGSMLFSITVRNVSMFRISQDSKVTLSNRLVNAVDALMSDVYKGDKTTYIGKGFDD